MLSMGIRIFVCFIFISLACSSVAVAEPPSESPLVMSTHVNISFPPNDCKDRATGLTVRQFNDCVTKDSLKYNWKELDKGQWRLALEIVDKLTEVKHTLLFLLVKDSCGIRLDRMLFDGRELGTLEMLSRLGACKDITAPEPAPAPRAAPAPTGGW